MKLEVLVTTMYQNDTAKYREMNLQTDVVIANQTDRNEYLVEQIGGHTLKMISTDTRGLSRNRNIAIALSSADLIMFMDDDAVFLDRYEKEVIEEFKKHPEADAIRFETNTVAISDLKKVEMAETSQVFRKATRRELARYGVCGLVIRAEILKRFCLHFNECFGSGTDNYCGEDTIFLQTMINKKIRLYFSPIVVADIDKSGSTWFEGYNEKYFYVTGRVFEKIYPHAAWALAIRSAWKFRKRGKEPLPFRIILNSYLKGIRDQAAEGKRQ